MSKKEKEMDYNIRKIESYDIEKRMIFMERIATESDDLSFSAGEIISTFEREKELVKNCIDSSNHYCIVTEYKDEIIGSLYFISGGRARNKHVGEFSVYVLKRYWGEGIATEMISSLLLWAKQNDKTKINLKVKEDNFRAIKLYEKIGFEVEGNQKREFLINGRYYGALLMGKIID